MRPSYSMFRTRVGSRSRSLKRIIWRERFVEESLEPFPPRHAVARARFFHRLAARCGPEQRDDFEAFVEASIVFARAAFDRLRAQHARKANCSVWWERLRRHPSFAFVDSERNWVLHQAPPKIGQVTRSGHTLTSAEESYFFETPDIPATKTLLHHLDNIERLVREAEALLLYGGDPPC